MLILAIDTSTSLLSLGLVKDGQLLASIDEDTNNKHSAVTMSKIEKLFEWTELTPKALDAIAVAIGPGSYTGIRVGVTIAKMLGYALNIPVYPISSLKIMAGLPYEKEKIAALIDARRGTAFGAVYHSNGETIVAEGHYDIEQLLEGREDVFIVGDKTLANKYDNIVWENEFVTSKALILARLAMASTPIENIHTLQPAYLRVTEAEANAGTN